MKKRSIILLLIVSILLIAIISSVNFISAGWWNNFYNKITGNDITANSQDASIQPGETTKVCNVGETKEYTCPDGTKVEWCHCSEDEQGWICINSPEIGCPATRLCALPGCEGAYKTGEYDGNCPIYKCPNVCSEGEVKKYSCSDGMQVDWCICNPNGWICVNNPKSKCPHSTCSRPVCAGAAYPTGTYDENDCPIYRCPEGETCSPGLGEELVCSDGTKVQGCKCSSQGKWECPADIENKCPNINITCPSGCICTNNAVSCPANITSTTRTVAGVSGGGSVGVCSLGCICTNQTITCPIDNETENGCAMGCKLNDSCVLPSIRANLEDKKQYCDVDSNWKNQKKR